jgi:hypothetical protein
MTIHTATSVVDYVSDGATLAYPVPYPFHEPEHLRVAAAFDPANLDLPASVLSLALGDYAVEGATVTLEVERPAGWTIRIRRVVPMVQGTDLREQGRFSPELLERGLDYLTMQVQQLNDGTIHATTEIVDVVTTAQNVNTAGVGVYKDKVGDVLRFRGIKAGSGKLTATLGADNAIAVDLGVVGPADVGAAPAAHVASRDGHPVATTTLDGFMDSADKAKLDGIEAGSNAYIHPTTHAPAIIAQDASNRFVTDAEKATWNAKVAPSHLGAVNPHGITPGLIGAATASALADLASAVDAHTSDTDNPHTVTAAQVGAPTLADLAAHVGNANNPHSVTAAQAGAAPVAHVGATGAAHGAATSGAAGFMQPAHVDALTGHETRIAALEQKPLRGVYVWNGVTWTSSAPFGLKTTAVRLGPGNVRVDFLSGLTGTDYAVAVSCSRSAAGLAATINVTSRTANDVTFQIENAESAAVDEVDFDVTMHP